MDSNMSSISGQMVNMDLEPVEEASRFTLFSALPPELRIMIWEEALPEDTPEVCTGSQMMEGGRPIVYAEYPIIMDVCHESRRIAEKRGRRHVIPGQGKVLVREFRPELDIMYVDHITEDDIYATNVMEPNLGALAAQIQHAAFDDAELSDDRLRQLLPMANLKTLHVVLMAGPSAWNSLRELELQVHRMPESIPENIRQRLSSNYTDHSQRNTRWKLHPYAQFQQDTQSRAFCQNSLNCLRIGFEEWFKALHRWYPNRYNTRWDNNSKTLKFQLVASQRMQA